MGEHLYVWAGLIALVWLIWLAITYRSRASMRLAREVDERLRMSTELLSTLPGSLRH